MDIRSLVVLHQLALKAEGASPKTQRQYLIFHRRFLDFLDTKAPAPYEEYERRLLRAPESERASIREEMDLYFGLDALNPTNLRQGLVWYQAQQNRQRTRGGQTAARAFVDLVKRLGKFGEEEGLYERSPVDRVKRVKATKFNRTPFSLQEINAIWAASMRTSLAERDQAIVLTLLDTGMRIGELCKLRRSDLYLDRDERFILVGSAGKGRRERRVPIGDQTKRDGGRTIRALKTYLAMPRIESRADEWVFLTRDSYQFKEDAGNDLIHRLGATAGVDPCYPHRFRHTFCTNYLTFYPGDEIGLRRIVGHLSREVLEDYVHFAESTVSQRAGRAAMSSKLLGA